MGVSVGHESSSNTVLHSTAEAHGKGKKEMNVEKDDHHDKGQKHDQYSKHLHMYI